MTFIDALEPRPLVRVVGQHRAALLALAMILVLANEAVLFGPNPLYWDIMFASGYAALIAGIALALRVKGKLGDTLNHLAHRGSLLLTDEELATLKDNLEVRAHVWSHRGGLALSLIVVIAFVWVVWPLATLSDIGETLLGAVAAYVAGRIIGRMVSYGFLGPYLHRESIPFVVRAGHVDGACGLKPLGDLYFFQAMLLAIPALYLALWSLLIPVWTLYDYTRWRDPYLGLLAVALVLEIAAFVLPMWTTHKDMQQEKDRLLKEADRLSREIVETRAKLTEATTVEEQGPLKDQLDAKMQRYQEIEEMPTWPVDRGTRRRFTVNNFAMFLPLLTQLIGATGPWQRFAEVTGRFLTSQP